MSSMTSGLVSECQVRPINTANTIPGISVVARLRMIARLVITASREPLRAPISAGSTLSPFAFEIAAVSAGSVTTRSLIGNGGARSGLILARIIT